MSRRRRKKNDSRGVGRLFLWTALLGVVFSAGIITGQRLWLEDNLPPLVMVGQPTPALSTQAATSRQADGEENRLSIFSFYEALTSPEVKKETAQREAPRPRTEPAAQRQPEPRPAQRETAPAAVEQPDPVVEAPEAPQAPVEEAEEQAQVVDSAEADQELPARYTLQVASHPSMERARAEMDRLRALGLDPHIVAADVPGQGQFFRVRIGKYHTMDEARAAQNTVQSDRAVQTFVTPL